MEHIAFRRSKMQALPLVNTLLLVGSCLWGVSGSMDDGIWPVPESGQYCSRLDGFKLIATLLPSELQILTCKCYGVMTPQACPTWRVLSGSQYFDVVFPNANPFPNSCNSFLSLKLKSNVPKELQSFAVEFQCEGGEQKKFGKQIVKKSRHAGRCNEDYDCFTATEKCVPRDGENCTLGKSCVRECNCPDHQVYIEDSTDQCYPKSHFGEPCQFPAQCQTGNAILACGSIDENHDHDNNHNHSISNVGTNTVCRCPSNLVYDQEHEECVVDETKTAGLSLTARVLIAVGCGIVGIGIVAVGCVILRMRSKGGSFPRKQRKDVDVLDDPNVMVPLQDPQPVQVTQQSVQVPEQPQPVAEQPFKSPELVPEPQEFLPPYTEQDQVTRPQDPLEYNIDDIDDEPEVKERPRLDEPV